MATTRSPRNRQEYKTHKTGFQTLVKMSLKFLSTQYCLWWPAPRPAHSKALIAHGGLKEHRVVVVWRNTVL